MKTFGKYLSKTLGILSGIIVFVIIIVIISEVSSKYIPLAKNKYEFIEGNKTSLNKIFILELSGLIVNQSKEGMPLLNTKIIYANEIEKIFEELSKETGLRAVIISINSPGGSVSGSNRFYNAIKNFKKENNIMVYIHTNELLASGAVWSSVAADKIYASYGAMIGSIGVKGPAWFVYNDPMSIELGLFSPSISTLNGIDYYQPYAGKSKDIFNPFRKPTNEELKTIQEMLDTIYDKFLNIISKNRNIEKKYIRENIGAMFFESSKAKFHNLIDDVISLDNTKSKIILYLGLQEDYQLLKIKSEKNVIEQFATLKLVPKNYYKNQIALDICNLYYQQFLLVGRYNFSGC